MCFRTQADKIGIISESEYSIVFRYRNTNDLLFSNRELRCLVAIELKIGEFEPEHLGKMNFHLEALDRDVKKEFENPSIGLILCAKKDAAVVEYAMSRSLSPALVAEYKLHLPEKRILENKLRELTALAESVIEEE